MILYAFVSHRHCVVCKEASHAAGAIADTERTSIGSVGAASARVKLVMVVWGGTDIQKRVRRKDFRTTNFLGASDLAQGDCKVSDTAKFKAYLCPSQS